MKRETKGYALIIVLFSVLALIIYGAYSPARKAQKQQIFCVKFKNGIDNRAVERHMHEFAGLKHEIKEIVNYSAGRTIPTRKATDGYDVVHYLTFQSEEDIKAFEKSAAYKEFIGGNQDNWDKILVVNAEIQP
jgi:hypothetical protein